VITITIPATDLNDAIAVRDRIRGLILRDSDTAVIVTGGVAVRTEDPVRVCLDLQAEGFID
jgi:hypothetical protein